MKEGYLDNRIAGRVVGQLTFAGLGTVDILLSGDFSGEIAGQVIGFRNSTFLDDPRAIESLEDFAVPQVGKVSLISFDPHPLLEPHPYVEWFALDEQHYRIELDPADAWVMTDAEREGVNDRSQRIHREVTALSGLPKP